MHGARRRRHSNIRQAWILPSAVRWLTPSEPQQRTVVLSYALPRAGEKGKSSMAFREACYTVREWNQGEPPLGSVLIWRPKASRPFTLGCKLGVVPDNS